ncbi:MAG: hypothetical protein A2284_08720 [Deltaproteobacteria bacterium RIFOXYA12_FULL_61_11]|nr:MAG: hypothetical protein A2284_08720 [Deltaproteobacteria bacterium RIFOXYA12_FULL_61_11]
MDRQDIIQALRSKGQEQKALHAKACAERERFFGNRVEVRSVIEYASVCQRRCRYCGLSQDIQNPRFVLTSKQFLVAMDDVVERGRRVVLVQSGEVTNQGFREELLENFARVRERHPEVELMCGFGTQDLDFYQRLRACGVQRYLLKFETSDEHLYQELKPDDQLEHRLEHLQLLRDVGFKVSSGNITGLPGQSPAFIADDLLFLRELAVPMGSTSPFIAGEHCALAGYPNADLDLTLNCLALMRLLCPTMLIPTVSALEIVSPGGLGRGLLAGANVVTIHDGTPRHLEDRYRIYKKERHLPRNEVLSTVAALGLRGLNTPLT